MPRPIFKVRGQLVYGDGTPVSAPLPTPKVEEVKTEPAPKPVQTEPAQPQTVEPEPTPEPAQPQPAEPEPVQTEPTPEPAQPQTVEPEVQPEPVRRDYTVEEVRNQLSAYAVGGNWYEFKDAEGEVVRKRGREDAWAWFKTNILKED